jgi:hypothetical protein
VRNRIIALGLLAYPRSTRDADGRYLRDLALELGDDGGIGRQFASLVLAGVRERIELHRTRASAGARWVIAGVAVAVMIPVALGVVAPSETDIGAPCEAGELVTSFNTIDIECGPGT